MPAKLYTFEDLTERTNEVAEAVIPLCATNVDGIEDWLSAAASDSTYTAAELAAEWDKFNNE